MGTVRRRWGRAAVAVGCLVTVTACSGGSEQASTPALPTLGTSSSSAAPSVSAPPSASPSPSASTTYKPGDPARIGSWNTFRSPSDLTGTERGVLAAWIAYWELTSEAFNTGGENLLGDEGLASLNAVAVESGAAWRLTFDGAARRGQKQIFTVGPTAFTVDKIEVKGNRATVRGCMNDLSYEVDQRGKTVQSPVGAVIVADQLVRVGGTWKMSAAPSVSGKCAG